MTNLIFNEIITSYNCKRNCFRGIIELYFTILTVPMVRNEIQFASASYCHRADHTSELWYPLPIKVSGPTTVPCDAPLNSTLQSMLLNRILLEDWITTSFCSIWCVIHPTVHQVIQQFIVNYIVLYLHVYTGQFSLINPWRWWNVEMYVCVCFPNGSIVNKVNTFVGKLSVRVFSCICFVRTGIV